ncbi:MAG: ATP-grasp domain-containing protein [Lachnospiraceae bacterium]|nr:ATP-grasp domain-containing protein [Candidatus Colinaster scatohippi]
MSRILVSGASGIVGYGILRNLKDGGHFLIGTTIYEESPANCFADIVLNPPMTVDPTYIEWLTGTIEEYKIDMIIPGIEKDMEVWNENRDILERTGAVVLLNNSELIRLCLDKWEFYKVLKRELPSLAIPGTIDYEEALAMKEPLLLKPRCGFGSKGIVRLKDVSELAKYKDSIGKELMVQKMIGDDNHEYTVSGFFDESSELKAIIAFKRKLSGSGYTENAVVIKEEDYVETLKALAKVFKPVGPTNFQFRNSEDGLRLLEINPRISSSTSIKAAFGYNEEVMSLTQFIAGESVIQPVIKRGHAMRYVEDFIVYE